tara:strand:- start:1549 stop:2118 length:570 start_codon:yes stop_codon:yes gene_type:complete
MSNELDETAKHELELVSINENLIQPHPQNARVGDVGAIRRSIKANGFFGAIVVQRSTGHILVGNHRYKAAKAEKLDEVPVMFIDCDDEKAVRILLADNKTSDLGGYNDEQLLDLLTNVSEAGELDGTGWNSEDVDKLLKMFNDLPELNTDPVDLQLNYSVLVSCDNDQHQRETLETLTSQGFQVSASML